MLKVKINDVNKIKRLKTRQLRLFVFFSISFFDSYPMNIIVGTEGHNFFIRSKIMHHAPTCSVYIKVPRIHESHTTQ